MTCLDDNALAQLVDGAVEPAEREAIERHLDGCAPCTTLLSELAWVVAPPRTGPPGYRLRGARGHDCWDADDLRTGRTVELCFHRGPALPAVAHPNLVAVLATGELERARHVATERIDAPTARAWLRAAPRTTGDVLAVWRQAIAGVAALHRAGGVHGGLSADRVFVHADGQAVVGAPGRRVAPGSGGAAAELLHGAEPSPASDQFALCAAIWEALAGRPPFEGPTIGALAVTMALPPAPAPTIPRRVRRVLARGLAAAPSARWPDLDALLGALDRPARRWWWWVAAAVALGVAAVIAA